VIAEFNVWLLIVGLVVGAGLVWVVTMDGRRRDAEIEAVELPREAAWLSAVLAEDGYDVSPDTAEQLLLLHRAYLGAPPPDPVPEVGCDPAPDPARDGVSDAAADDEVPQGDAVRPGSRDSESATDASGRSPHER
jgi:hypothetical protein